MFRHVFLDLFRRSGLNPKHGPRKIALRALEGELALPQNRNPVAQGLNLGRIVAAEKQRDLLPSGKVPQKLPHLAFPRTVECRGWFVEEQARWPGGGPRRASARSSSCRRRSVPEIRTRSPLGPPASDRRLLALHRTPG